ncbi:MAG: L-seryl-tRNA(Sec) selenium transferase, partial [Anaerolineales bacterium]
MTETEKRSNLRKLPSVNALLQSPDGVDFVEEYGHDLTVSAMRYVLENIRKKVGAEQGTIPLPELILQDVLAYLQQWTSPTLEPVIIATGVIVHTNVGRAPLSTVTINAMQKIAQGYSTLEYDL